MSNPMERFYTPNWMGRAQIKRLRRHIPQGARVLEPCAGPGCLASELRAAGWAVTTGDLDPSVVVDHHWDFVEAVGLGRVEPFDAVITNAPFSLTTPMVKAAMAVAPLVSFLLPLSQLEAASGRGAILHHAGLWRVTTLPRGEFIYPKGVKRPKHGVSFTCIWATWKRGYTGRASMDWVTEQEKAKLMGQTDLVSLCQHKARPRPLQPQQMSLVGGAS